MKISKNCRKRLRYCNCSIVGDDSDDNCDNAYAENVSKSSTKKFNNKFNVNNSDSYINNNKSRIEKWLKEEKYRFKKQIRLLLLGTGESGKSTVLKQMKIIHGQNLFDEQQSDELKHIIYLNILKGIKVLIDAKKKLSIEWSKKSNNCNDNNSNNNNFGDNDIQSKADLVFRADTKNFITFEYFSRYSSLIEEIWNDQGIQETFQKRNLYQLSDGLSYLLNNLKRISSTNYIPTNQDLLHARVPTRTVVEYQVNYKSITFQFIDVGGQRAERRKWLRCFDNMLTSILFIVSSIEYDQHLVEDSTTNRLIETLNVFEVIINLNYFQNASIILFLNKTDLLIDKLKQMKKYCRSTSRDRSNSLLTFTNNSYRPQLLNEIFPEYDGDPTNLQQVQQFLLRLFVQRQSFRQLYPHFTTAVDTENIKRVFNDVRETVLQENIKSIIDLQ